MQERQRFIPILKLLIISSLLFTACGGPRDYPTTNMTPPFQTESPPTLTPESGENSSGADEVILKARQALAAHLGIEVSAVAVSKVEAIQWPDSCLGIQIPGQMCAMHVVDGYRVILEVNNQRYEYHTNGDGSSLEPILALTWHREGGIAGFCDDLIINVVGEATTGSCLGTSSVDNNYVLLKAQQREELNKWLSTLQPFTIDRTDPAVADAMTIAMVFSGWGTGEVSKTQKQVIEQFAADLYTEVSQTQ